MEYSAGAISRPAEWGYRDRSSFMIYANKQVKELWKEVKMLDDKLMEVSRVVEDALIEGRSVIAQVREWQMNTENLIEVSYQFLERVENAGERWGSLLRLNIIYHYKTGIKASKLRKLINDTYLEAMSFHLPATPPVAQMIVSSHAATSREELESRERLSAELIKSLQTEEVNVIGIVGMGGVGKTTLVDRLALHAIDRRIFHVVAKAVVSKDPRIKDIQESIAERFQYKFEAKGVIERKDELIRVISARLERQEKILVIFDDVWKPLDFTSEIGIPRSRYCKVVITSRNTSVLSLGAMNADAVIEVKTLGPEESRLLFMKSLGKFSSTVANDLRYMTIIDDILVKCGGLPLAIVAIASALKGKDYRTWEDIGVNLSRGSGRETEGIEYVLQRTIMISLDSLHNEEARKLLMLCSLFPEDAVIEVTQLVSYGFAVDLFEGGCRFNEAISVVYGLLEELSSRCLLITGEDDEEKSHNHSVQIQNLIRDIAIDIAWRAKIDPFALISSREEYNFFTAAFWPEKQDRVAISLSIDNIEDIGNHGRRFTEIRILCLHSTSRDDTIIPPDFFLGMENLRVLDMSTLYPQSGFDLSQTSSSIGSLVNLRSLHLVTTDVVGRSAISQLTNLEFLSLKIHTKKELNESTHLDFSACELKSLVLTAHYHVNLDDLNKFPHLQMLQAKILVGDDSQMLEKNISIGPVLARLFSFKLNITSKLVDPIYAVSDRGVKSEHLLDKPLSKALFFANIQSSSMHPMIGEGIEFLGLDEVEGLVDLKQFKCLMSLRGVLLENCKEMKYAVSGHNVVPSELQYLALRNLPKLENITAQPGTVLWKSSFSALKEIHLRQLPNINYNSSVIAGNKTSHLFGPEDVFPEVRLVDLYGLHCDEIWHCPMPAGSFSGLCELIISDMPHLTYLFPSLAFCTQHVTRLETLEIQDCERLEVVISEVEEGDEKDISNFKILSIVKISLMRLASLSCFCGEKQKVLSFPHLQKVDISKCPKMKSFAHKSPIAPSLTDDQGSKLDDLNKYIEDKWSEAIAELQFLDDKPAMALFKKTLGDKLGDFEGEEKFEETAKSLLQCCGRLHLAIVVLAGALKEEEYSKWKDVADLLRKKCRVKRGKQHIAWFTVELNFKCLQNETAKSLFLLCSLFPKGQSIEVGKLMTYAWGTNTIEGNFETDLIREPLDQLISSNLLRRTENNEGAFCLHMHDVIRDAAIKIASTKHNYFIGKHRSKEDLSTKYAISRSMDGCNNWCSTSNLGCQFSDLEILKLHSSSFHEHGNIPISADFFKGKEKLKVLDMSCSKDVAFDFHQLWSSMSLSLQGLQTLHLTAKDVADISAVGWLTNLKYLCLNANGIIKLPESFKRLVSLKMLDISRCSELRKVPDKIIASLSRLQHLYTAGINVNPIKLLSSPHLKPQQAYLSVIDESHHMPRHGTRVESILSRLFQFNLIITSQSKPSFGEWDHLTGITTGIELTCLAGERFEKALFFVQVPRAVMFPGKFWEKLQFLCCDGVTGLLDLTGIKFSSLRGLFLGYCKELKSVFAPDDRLPTVRCLVLCNLPELEGLCGQGAFWKTLFPSIREIFLSGLPKFMYNTITPPASGDNVRYLFGHEDVLPEIETVKIEDMYCDEIWHSPALAADSFSLLRQLQITKLPHLKCVFPSMTFCTELLTRLEIISVQDCDNLQVVIYEPKESEVLEDAASMPTNNSHITKVIAKLKKMVLSGLPSLFNFYEGTETLNFPLLESIHVNKCGRFMSFAPTLPSTPPGLSERSGHKVDDLNSFIKQKWEYECRQRNRVESFAQHHNHYQREFYAS